MTTFKDMDTDIYTDAASHYIPKNIKFLFIAESPPAFKGNKPIAYFYFENVKRADSLFYTLIKATLNVDFRKKFNNRIEILERFRRGGYFLIDAVDYPINKDREWNKIPNPVREQIIQDNYELLKNKIQRLKILEFLLNETKIILIKKSVFNQLHYKIDNVINKNKINFPKCAKDRDVIKDIRNLIIGQDRKG